MNDDKGTIALLANALSQLLKGNSDKQESEKKEPSVGGGEQNTTGSQGENKPTDKPKEPTTEGGSNGASDNQKDLDTIVGEKVEKVLANALEKLATNSSARGAVAAPMGFGLPSGTAISTNSNDDKSARLARLPE